MFINHTLNKMQQLGIPLTRDNYILFSYLGEKEYEDLDGEELGMLPDIWDENGELIQ
jgi:hypothetical protein